MSASPGEARRGRVLILVENLPVPFDRRVWLESKALTRAGWLVSVICPKGGAWTADYEEIEGVHIHRYEPPPPTKGAASYVWEFLYCWVQTLRLTIAVAAGRGFDVIYIGVDPIFDPIRGRPEFQKLLEKMGPEP